MPCAKVHITSSACPKNNVAVWSDLWIASRGDSRTDWSVDCLQRRFKNKMICGLLTEEIQEQTDLWIAYRGDSRTKWSVDCLQRRFKNRLICGLLTEEIQDRETRKWLTFKRTEKIKVMCTHNTHTLAHTYAHTHTHKPTSTQKYSAHKHKDIQHRKYFSSLPPPPLKLLLVTSPGHEWWW